MTITCQICKKSFSKQITNSHLKTHNISTFEYKEKFGEHSLSSSAYRAEKSQAVSGINNPNYNKKWSNKLKKSLSEKLKGKPAHNKGKSMSEKQKNKLSDLAKQRPATRTGATLTKKTKQQISKSIQNYALQNPKKMKDRAKRSVETKKKPGGYYEKKHQLTIKNHIDVLHKWGYSGVYINNHYEISCNICSTIFNRISLYMMHEKMCNKCYPAPSISKDEQNLYTWIKETFDTKVLQSDKTVFGNGFEIDILLPEYNVGIEYNGLYWHSENQGKSRWYHKTKHQKAKDKGIHLIQIFEDEWIHKQEIVKQRLLSKLGNSEKIYARKCKIVDLTSKDANIFLKKIHIQGVGYGIINYGLLYDNNLVGVMKFSNLSISKGYKDIDGAFELNRYASIGNIIGGASRLFKHFIKHNNPSMIISYSDLRWNTGKVYENIGMVHEGDTTPGYWYINHNKRIHRFKLRKTKHDPKHLSEWEIRKAEGWNRIWDCGHAKYIWHKKDQP